MENTNTEIVKQRYAAVGTLSVILWDIALHLPQDYKLAKRQRTFNPLYLIYCIARLASLAYVLGIAIFTTALLDNCNYARIITMIYPLTIPLSILPFVVRVYALYGRNKFIGGFFLLSWLFVLGSCISVPIGSVGVRIGTTQLCSHGLTGVTDGLALFSPLVHDSLVFVATAWALMGGAYHYDATVTSGIQVMFLGKYLHPFSRSMLRDGQIYYLLILIANITVVVLCYMPRVVETPCTIGVVIMSNMSSYVYRNMVLGHKDYTAITSLIDRDIRRAQESPQAHSELVFRTPRASTRRTEEAGSSGIGGP